MPQDKVVTFPRNGLDRRPAAPQPEPSRFADGRAFGEYLRQHRQARHVSIHEIAGRTKILASRLEALERGDIRLWPAGIYRRAIVRDYACAIGLDPDDVVKEFMKLFPVPEPNPAPAPPPQARRVMVPATLLRLFTQGVRLPRPGRWSIPQLSVSRIVTSRRAWGTLGSVVVGAVLGASTAWIAMDVVRGRVESAPQPDGPAAPLSTGSIHTARLVVDSSRAAGGPAAGSRFEEPLSASPTGRVTATAANAGIVGTAARSAVQHAIDTTTQPEESIEGRLRVTSNVPGARVTVNGIGWGSTPLVIRYLPPGPKRIRATMDGYRSVERTVELTPERSDLAVRLELRPLERQ
jgi:transcriptional regulator with XRE-family HTH domain